MQAELGRPLALIADLQGPKFRIDDLASRGCSTTGTTVYVASEAAAHDGDLVVAPAAIAEVLEPGHDVLIDDGLIRLAVEEVDGRPRALPRGRRRRGQLRTRA